MVNLLEERKPSALNGLRGVDFARLRRHTFKRVETREEFEAVLRLRYQVYVEERGFERAEDHAGQIETDEFDRHSIHFIGIDPDGRVIGTMRLVRDSELGYPLLQHCRPRIDFARIRGERLAEISRLAISKRLRRRADDTPFGLGREPRAKDEEGRRRFEIVLGLYKAMWRESMWEGITDWCCAMERCLSILLRRQGIPFTQIGDEIDYHGRRAPYIARLGQLMGNMAKRQPELFHFFTDWPRSSQVRL